MTQFTKRFRDDCYDHIAHQIDDKEFGFRPKNCYNATSRSHVEKSNFASKKIDNLAGKLERCKKRKNFSEKKFAQLS